MSSPLSIPKGVQILSPDPESILTADVVDVELKVSIPLAFLALDGLLCELFFD